MVSAGACFGLKLVDKEKQQHAHLPPQQHQHLSNSNGSNSNLWQGCQLVSLAHPLYEQRALHH